MDISDGVGSMQGSIIDYPENQEENDPINLSKKDEEINEQNENEDPGAVEPVSQIFFLTN